MSVFHDKCQEIINALPGGFRADWTMVWTNGQEDDGVETSGPDWTDGIDDDRSDLREQAKEYTEKVENAVEESKKAEKECEYFLQCGNLEEAKEALDRASECEAEFGDNPSYQYVIKLLDRLIEEEEEENEE